LFWDDQRNLDGTRDAIDRFLQGATPPLLFGLRMWAAVILALTVAFWLELDNASWAGTTAAIVCQPVLGASLRKGWFRMIGTLVGAIAIVVLTACFPQNRFAFFFGLALWGGICAFAATVLRNFASYAAALAGFTAAIVAGDEMGLVGGANGDAFMLAINRLSEICIGIVSAGIVLAGTDFGRARHQLAATLAGLATEVTGRLIEAFHLSPSQQAARRPVRRDLIRRVSALDTIIDEATGEAPELRFNPRPLQAAVEGLFGALSGWRVIGNHLEDLDDRAAAEEAAVILEALPAGLRSVQPQLDAPRWRTDPSSMIRVCRSAVRALVALPTEAPSVRLLADRTAEALSGVANALGGLVLLHDPRQAVARHRVARVRMPDLFPPVLNGVRAAATIAAAALLWIVTEWPGGALAITFAALTVIVLSPRADQAYAMAKRFLLGTTLGAVLAAIVGFGVLPGLQSYAGFCFALGLVLIPVGAMVAQSWEPLVFTAASANFVPILGPANQMSYDIQQFYNSALAIVGGVGIAMLAIRLLPPPSAASYARRLLALTLRDLRRMVVSRTPHDPANWEGRVYARFAAMPDKSDPLYFSWLAAALSVGTEVIRLRRVANQFGIGGELGKALQSLARGDSATAIAWLGRFDAALAAIPGDRAGAGVRLRARGAICAISEALARHSPYFDWP
jgi:uncharacterized membrane protein YccC